MTPEDKHDCFNRERRDAYLAPARVYTEGATHYVIEARQIPDRSSRECQYSKDVVDAHCVGCRHNRQATEGRQLYEPSRGPQLQAWSLDRPEPPL